MKKPILFFYLFIAFFISVNAQVNKVPETLTVTEEGFFPEDIVIANNVAYVSGLGDGTVRTFDLTQENPTAQLFAAAEEGYTQRWGLKSDGTTLLSILDNADFGGGESGPAKLVAYDIATRAKTGEWDLPAGAIGHTVSIVEGKYYVTDFGSPRIMEIDPATGTVNGSWFTSAQWDPTISGIGGTIYDNEGGLYISQGNKMWYLPISGGQPGTLQQVNVAGLDAVDADGISWDDDNNTLYYATNDTGDPANVGTVYKLVFSDATTATGSVVATGFDDASGLWYYENGGKEYLFLLESQFGGLFGINGFEPPFNIEVLELAQGTPSNLTSNDPDFFPEDITIVNNVAYVSGLGDGTLQLFNLNLANPTEEIFAAAEEGYTQRWGVKSDGTTLLSILDNADFGGGESGPAKLVAYDIATRAKTGEWDLPAGAIGHTVSIVEGKYYVTDFGSPRIMEIDPATGTVNGSWFTSAQWDPTISGIGGTIYDNEGGLYISQGNKMWYLPISGGQPGTLQQVNVAGLDAVDADGISWDDDNNTLYYATNDTGDPANVGTVYKLVFSDATTATGSVVATGFDDASGLWYYENGGNEYLFLLESQFGGLFGINGFEPPFNIEILELAQGTPSNLTSNDPDFFPEDITIVNNVAYVSGLGDGTLQMFNLNLANPTGEIFAAAEEGYTQRWGLKSDGTTLLSILDNADFGGGESGPAKLVAYDIATRAKTGEWDLPAGAIGHTVSIVEGKYYVTDFGSPRIMEIDPATGTVNGSWFTSAQWDPTISGIGGTIYDNEGGLYISQGNKMWYLPISGGQPGTLQQVNVAGLDAVDADGISWDDDNNTLYYATNDTGDPANVGTVYKLVFSDVTTATGSVVATGFDDASGLWYYENRGNEYLFLLESQFGGLFGINGFEPPFNIEIIELNSDTELTNEIKARAVVKALETGDPVAFGYISDEQYIQHNLAFPTGKEAIASFFMGEASGITVDIHRSFEIGDFVVLHTTYGGAWAQVGGSGSAQVAFDVFRFENGLIVEHWDNLGDVVDDMDGTSQTDGAVTPATGLENTGANQALLETMAQTLFVDGDWTNVRDYFDLDNYIQHSVGSGADGAFLATLEGQTGLSFYDDVKFIHTLGNFGLVMSQGPDITGQDPDGTYAYYDLFRLENGKIVEHWDVIQLIPLQDQWVNTNGKWGDDAIISSIENVLAQNTTISLAPNPFRAITQITINTLETGDFLFQVFDMAGKEVANQKVNITKGLNTFQFDGNHLGAGIYNYQLSNNQGFVNGKMIIAK